MAAHNTRTPHMEKGSDGEQRFFDVAKPEQIACWVVSVESATGQQNARGIDAVVTIKRRGTNELVRVPIQVKSSQHGVECYYLSRLSYWWNRVPCVVVNEERSDGNILAQLRAQLDHPRKHRYDFEEIFADAERAITRPMQVKMIGAITDWMLGRRGV